MDKNYEAVPVTGVKAKEWAEAPVWERLDDNGSPIGKYKLAVGCYGNMVYDSAEPIWLAPQAAADRLNLADQHIAYLQEQRDEAIRVTQQWADYHNAVVTALQAAGELRITLDADGRLESITRPPAYTTEQIRQLCTCSKCGGTKPTCCSCPDELDAGGGL